MPDRARSRSGFTEIEVITARRQNVKLPGKQNQVRTGPYAAICRLEFTVISGSEECL